MASVSRATMETLDQLARGSFVDDHEGSTPSGNTPPTLHPSDVSGPSSVMPHMLQRSSSSPNYVAETMNDDKEYKGEIRNQPCGGGLRGRRRCLSKKS
ncbi:hypothetical protein LINPERPRIM_LOCUS1367 [Linum perenne]